MVLNKETDELRSLRRTGKELDSDEELGTCMCNSNGNSFGALPQYAIVRAEDLAKDISTMDSQ
jgi:hypothetical protein